MEVTHLENMAGERQVAMAYLFRRQNETNEMSGVQFLIWSWLRRTTPGE